MNLSTSSKPTGLRSSGERQNVDASAGADAADQPRVRRSWGRRLSRSTATSWCLSVALHITGYLLTAAMLAWLGIVILPNDPDPDFVARINASLGDEDVTDDLPALEIVQAAGQPSLESETSLQQLAQTLTVTSDGPLESVVTDANIAVVGSEDAHAVEEEAGGPFFRIPESGLAVTKGSFTAWTDPPYPRAGERYQIIIEIRLPEKLQRYRLSDLSGRVVGTDDYEQKLPWDRRARYATRVTGGAKPVTVSPRQRIDVTGGKVQLAIRVPGADRLVKDTIHIRSRRLREEQKLTLVFGRRPPVDNKSR